MGGYRREEESFRFRKAVTGHAKTLYRMKLSSLFVRRYPSIWWEKVLFHLYNVTLALGRKEIYIKNYKVNISINWKQRGKKLTRGKVCHFLKNGRKKAKKQGLFSTGTIKKRELRKIFLYINKKIKFRGRWRRISEHVKFTLMLWRESPETSHFALPVFHQIKQIHLITSIAQKNTCIYPRFSIRDIFEKAIIAQ